MMRHTIVFLFAILLTLSCNGNDVVEWKQWPEYQFEFTLTIIDIPAKYAVEMLTSPSSIDHKMIFSQAMKMVKAKDAKLIEIGKISDRSGMRATYRNAQAFEYLAFKDTAAGEYQVETRKRDVGTILAVEPVFDPQSDRVDLSIEITHDVGPPHMISPYKLTPERPALAVSFDTKTITTNLVLKKSGTVLLGSFAVGKNSDMVRVVFLSWFVTEIPIKSKSTETVH